MEATVHSSFDWVTGPAQSVALGNLRTGSVLRNPRPETYLPDPGLQDAANVALLLGQPLLLTGEPGTGKTRFAHYLAWKLGLGQPLKFETKSTSVASDLFYIYNTVGRFHAAQTGEGSQSSVDYITYQALGQAILRAKDPSQVVGLISDASVHVEPRRSVVLIDEIDKAPRDFPNDILNEIEGMYFRIPELGNREVRAEADWHPVVVISSNSEKHLPEAFLRRCVYYHIEFPDKRRLEEISLTHLGELLSDESPLLQDALALFSRIRAPENNLRKPPATGELLS